MVQCFGRVQCSYLLGITGGKSASKKSEAKEACNILLPIQ